jgi:hypothetical protein
MGDRKIQAGHQDFIVRNPEDGVFEPTLLDPTPPAVVPLPEGREPVVPGVPAQTGKPRFVPAELWVLVRACAEGRRLGLEALSGLTGISISTIQKRATDQAWLTPNAVRKANEKKINTAIESVFGDIADYIGDYAQSDGLADNAAGSPKKVLEEERGAGESGELAVQDSLIDTPGANVVDLRTFVDTPKKFQPKEHQLLPKEALSLSERREQIERLRYDLKNELSKSADLHQLAVSEIAKITTLHLLEKVAEDPSLGILLADKFEKLDKVARRNLRLDVVDSGGGRGAPTMSDPGIMPRPVISVDAEVLETHPLPTPTPTPQHDHATH